MRNQKVRTLFRKGLNLRDDPTAIDAEESPLLQNVIPDKFGVLNTRPSMTYMETVLGALGEVAGAGYRPFFTYLRPIDFIFSTVPGCEIVMVCRLLSAAPGSGHSSMTGGTTGLNLGYYVLAIATDGLGFSATFYGHVVSPQGSVPELPSRPFLKNSGETTWVLFKEATYVVHNVDGTRLPVDNTGPINNGIRIDKARLGGTAEFAKSSFYPRCMTEWDKGGRVLFGNLGEGKLGSSVIVSDGDLGAATNSYFVGNSAVPGYDILIGDVHEGPLTAVHNVANSPENYVQQRSILCFKRNALYRILGEIGLTTAAADTRYANAEVVKSQIAAGCVSQNTIQDTPYGTIWAGPDDVWFMPFGNAPMRIGTKLRPMLAAQSQQAQERWFATYHDGLYHLHVARDGQSLTDEAEQCEAEYTLDMRRGPPENADAAVWYGPQLHKASNCTAGVCRTRVDTRGGKTARVTGMTYGQIPGTNPREFVTLCDMQGDDTYDTGLPQPERDWQPNTAYNIGDLITPGGMGQYVDDNFAMTFECSTAGTSGADWSAYPPFNGAGFVVDNSVSWRRLGSDAARGLTWKEDVCNCEARSAQSGNAIIPKLVTKEFGEETAELEKLITGGYLTYFAAQGFRAAYNFLTDTEANTRDFGSSDGSNLDYDTIDETLALERRWQARFLAPDSTKRSRARTFQLSFETQEGIIIPAGFYLTARYIDNGVTVTRRSGVLGGYYANRNEIANQIAALFTSVGSFTWDRYKHLQVLTWLPLVDGDYGYIPLDAAMVFPAITAVERKMNAYIMAQLGIAMRPNGQFLSSFNSVLSQLNFPPGPPAESGLNYANEGQRQSGNVRMHFKDFTIRFRTFKRNPV